jgi:hypothetical protein
MLYQLGYFGYNEGEMIPNIILEHEKIFTEKEISDMLIAAEKSEPDRTLFDKDVAEKLCQMFGFKIVQTTIINTDGMYGL